MLIRVLLSCSAGVGRTGTYISIDVQLQRMKQEGDINVTQFVMQMRAQRSYMVQTEVHVYNRNVNLVTMFYFLVKFYFIYTNGDYFGLFYITNFNLHLFQTDLASLLPRPHPFIKGIEF